MNRTHWLALMSVMVVEELRMRLAWRWFTGLGFDQEIPHHSTFSKNRHGRFQESKLFEKLFEQIVGTQESDRVAPLAPPQTEVRAGAVLPGSGGAEHQATGALPQPTHNTCYPSCLLAEVRRKNSAPAIMTAQKPTVVDLSFSFLITVHSCKCGIRPRCSEAI